MALVVLIFEIGRVDVEVRNVVATTCFDPLCLSLNPALVCWYELQTLLHVHKLALPKSYFIVLGPVLFLWSHVRPGYPIGGHSNLYMLFIGTQVLWRCNLVEGAVSWLWPCGRGVPLIEQWFPPDLSTSVIRTLVDQYSNWWQWHMVSFYLMSGMASKFRLGSIAYYFDDTSWTCHVHDLVM